MASVQLEAVRLTKRFGDRTAVDGLSFAARQGEVMGLLGPNGSGKTTTIRLLTTVLAPTTGEFSVAGVPCTRPGEIRRRIGVLPESSGYPGHQTGEEYLRHHARLFGRARADAARVAGRLLAEVGLAERASSRISTYSRGMRQRLGIARALVNDPAVVFLDEPTLGLDPAGQRQVLSIVREIAVSRGATVILSTHTLPEVEEICTSVLILHKGKALVSGTFAEVTRAVPTQQHAQVRVPIELVGRAREALAGVAGLTMEPADERPDILRISLSGRPVAGQGGTETGMNGPLRAVLSADVPVLAFEVEGARLSDAFLAMTTEGVR
ncbi:ABC transporter ATP-binding protein [Micromonospora inositola]|uniref:ABC-2 type transport system ATP-binding protein n=1 Tax=Micromonospora inositola TaxID=47865 RepID=A0A1C5J7W7_9ACTN|nr:ABC transporter ATP-binding protein [Micromonospora inositola]SCG66638.1 ABC-2 type transport system ATP-binding protein [Micromonospora inositola]